MHVNNACMFYAPHASIVVWKSQIGAKSQVNYGAGKKLTCFDPLWKGCRIFLLVQHNTYNIQLTKIMLMKYFCFKILQSSPYPGVIGHGIVGKDIPIMARLAKARCWSKR